MLNVGALELDQAAPVLNGTRGVSSVGTLLCLVQMGCTVSRNTRAVADEAAWHDAGTPQAEEKKAAALRASRRRLTVAAESALPRQLFHSGVGAPRGTSLDKKLEALKIDQVVQFHVDAASIVAASAQPQPQRRPHAAPSAPSALAAAPTAEIPAVDLLDNAATPLPSGTTKKPALPASVVGIAERLSSQGQVGPVQPNGSSSRPRVAQQMSNGSRSSTGRHEGARNTSDRKLVPGIVPRGPIDSRSRLVPEGTATCPFSPRSATSDPCAASERSIAARRATVDVLLRGAHGEIPVGQAQWCSTGSDTQKCRPAVRRKAGSASIARCTSGSSAGSADSDLRTQSAGSSASSGDDDPRTDTPSLMRPLEGTSDILNVRSAVSDVIGVEADKENVVAGQHSQTLKSQKGRRKYPTADVRAFVKAARLPSTIVPRLLELLAGKDVAHLQVSFTSLLYALAEQPLWRRPFQPLMSACADHRPYLGSYRCLRQHSILPRLWRSSGWTKGRRSSSCSGLLGRTHCSWTSSYVFSLRTIPTSPRPSLNEPPLRLCWQPIR